MKKAVLEDNEKLIPLTPYGAATVRMTALPIAEKKK